ncbi:hypothetical protein, partial [Enterococcus faecium]
SAWRWVWKAKHQLLTGQLPQIGFSGRQIVAPSSMRAWFQSPGHRGFSTSVAQFQAARCNAGP